LNETWVKDPELIQRARIVLVLFLSKKSKGELVELIMNWLDDSATGSWINRIWLISKAEGRPRWGVRTCPRCVRS
jgi:hypothetical protein